MTCPLCGGASVPLGALGNLMHYRCQACGMDYQTNSGRYRHEVPEAELDFEVDYNHVCDPDDY